MTYKIANWENGQRTRFVFVEILSIPFVRIQIQTFLYLSQYKDFFVSAQVQIPGLPLNPNPNPNLFQFENP